jgi:hypothetical protein
VPGLIVKEEIGLELLQKWPLAQSAQKHRLIDADAPSHECADRPLVCRRAASGHKRGPNPHRGWPRRRSLQAMERFEKRLEGAGRQRVLGPIGFVTLEGGQAIGLVHPLRFIGKQHRIAVEGNPDLIGMRL